MRRTLLLFLGVLAGLANGPAAWGPGSALAQRKRLHSPLLNVDDFLLSPEVSVLWSKGKASGLWLAESELITDEMGGTDPHQGETLSDRVWAKKAFMLDSTHADSAELFLYGAAQVIRVNGQELEPGTKLVSTGWTRIKVPPKLLQVGANEVILSGKGRLAFEPGRGKGRSWKTLDAGRTWSDRALGRDDNQVGEYLVRLRLGRHPARGWATSPVLDYWINAPSEIGTPTLFPTVPARSDHAWLRTGSTPTVDPRTWTNWIRLDREYVPPKEVVEHRWFQLKWELISEKRNDTPVLSEDIIVVGDSPQPKPQAKVDDLKVQRQEPLIRISSVPHTYQEPTPRLKLLRDRYQLDKVIAAGKTEMEQLMLLRWWIRNQWHTAWEGGPAAWMPPWDAHIILESKDQSDCLTMCTHYATVFTQCCLALGWNARHCILDHHCVSEVWVEQHHKWVMMDTGNSKPRPDCGLHFERDGVPLSALELHLAYRDKKTDGIQVCFTPQALAAKVADLCRPAPKALPERPDTVPIDELKNYKVCQIENYRRYAFPDRNNYLTSLLPGELYQGFSSYAYDGYWWVGDNRDNPTLSPEYSRHLDPARPQDIDWTVNWSRIHLARTTKSGELRVDLETFTPNLARLEKQDEKGNWQATPASFVWKLEPGKNALAVRSVNKFERAGGVARVTVEVAK